MEVCIWVFDCYGECEKWMKVCMKFLIKKMGVEVFMKLVKEEWLSLFQQFVLIVLEEEEVFLFDVFQGCFEIKDQVYY